ncbi:MAG: selenocysteine-specific translation elongation factor, partial [Candidatus Krumholzibacteria bacterium]|nr:selenocysteine-specific translation elongation factor [Candidatus Krumholzibacteria bacterium]
MIRRDEVEKSVKHIIIGTAGHVDHGKTEIVRALTGFETDRLAEEKARGISIVLGFAPIDLGPGIEAGVVDVPGHERFVKNMVSGAVGVDVALIVVAADEGVMPQTEEHFEVLRLLGVSSGVIAVTKADLVDAETAEIVESEVADMLRGTPLEGAPFVRTSTVTGQGIVELREALSRTVRSAASRAAGEFFRMPVDRVFTRSGIGTIVTGTTWSGSARTGDELVLEPAGVRVRVREVQSFEHDIDASSAGMRTAVALHGIKVEDIATGDQLIAPGALPVSSILDVRLEMSRLPGSRLRSRQRIRFHHAAAEILGRA